MRDMQICFNSQFLILPSAFWHQSILERSSLISDIFSYFFIGYLFLLFLPCIFHASHIRWSLIFTLYFSCITLEGLYPLFFMHHTSVILTLYFSCTTHQTVQDLKALNCIFFFWYFLFWSVLAIFLLPFPEYFTEIELTDKCDGENPCVLRYKFATVSQEQSEPTAVRDHQNSRPWAMKARHLFLEPFPDYFAYNKPCH